MIMALVATATITAQTQEGVVKTRGRMINGQHVPGKGLPGAVVSIKGRGDVGVKNSDGSFSFPVTDKQFQIVSVTKKEYQLVDADAAPKTYTHSGNKLYFIMETPEQIMQDKLDSERRIRRTLQRQLQEREDEIETLKAENRISQQEYQQALQKLYANQENNERLISDMAERYSTLDYDQMDEFYRQVNQFIENGELAKADSLLKSRGDVNSQVEAHLREGKTIQEKEKELEQAKAVHKHDLEELALRCYSHHEKFLMEHRNDSAAYYLELRAKLDTTNVEWQNDAARFIKEYQARYDDALEYLKRALRHSIIQYDEFNDWTATLYNNIGLVYDSQGIYEKALVYHNRALEICEKVLGAEHPNVALSYNNIGVVYGSQGDYEKALEYHNRALAISEKVFGTEHPDVAQSYNNIGLIYYSQGDYEKALEYFKKTLAIYEKVFGTEHPNVATSYNNIGSIYNSQGDYEKALEYHNRALAIREKVFGTEHPHVATSYNNIGLIYGSQGIYEKALEYFKKALAIFEKVLGTEHPNVAQLYNNIGFIYRSQGNYRKALEYYKKTLAIFEKILETENEKTLLIRQEIMALTAYDREAMKEHLFTITTVNGNTAAKQQGMDGEYIVLEFADWTINSATSLFDKNNELRGKPKTLVVMKDGKITKHYFENVIGVSIGLKQVGKENKDEIVRLYEEWKAGEAE